MSSTRPYGRSMDMTEEIRDLYRDVYQATLDRRDPKFLPATDDDSTNGSTFYTVILLLIVGSFTIFFYHRFRRADHILVRHNRPLKSPVRTPRYDPSIFMPPSPLPRSPRRLTSPMVQDAGWQDGLPTYEHAYGQEAESSSETSLKRIGAATCGALRVAIQIECNFVRNVVADIFRWLATATDRCINGTTYRGILDSEIPLPSWLASAWAGIKPFAVPAICFIGLIYVLHPILLPGLPMFPLGWTTPAIQWREVPHYSWSAWLRGEEAPTRVVVDSKGTTRVIDYYGTRTITSSSAQPATIPYIPIAEHTSVDGHAALQLPKQVAPWIPWSRNVPKTAPSLVDEPSTETQTIIVIETQGQAAPAAAPPETATIWSVITVTHNHTDLPFTTTTVTETERETATVTMKQFPIHKRILAGNVRGEPFRHSHGDFVAKSGLEKTRDFIVEPGVIRYCKVCKQRHCCEFEHH